MGSKYPVTARQAVYQAIMDRDGFLRACFDLLSQVDLKDLARRPCKIESFLQAYLLARCLPIVMEEHADEEGFGDGEQLGESLYRVLIAAETFIDRWTPRSQMEAALMLDVLDRDDDWNDTLRHVPQAVRTYLFETEGGEPFAGTAAVMLAEFGSILSAGM